VKERTAKLADVALGPIVCEKKDGIEFCIFFLFLFLGLEL
jgi:hypothetical protein